MNLGMMKRRYGPDKSELDFSKQYFTLKALESGTFAFSSNIDYSVDKGSTWISLTANTASPTINEGDVIMFKSVSNGSSTGVGKFSSTGEFEAMGNVMSLLFGDDFIGKVSLSRKLAPFYEMFKSSKIVSAENLIFPATTLVSACYEYMFQNCTSLEKAPIILPTITLTTDCYRQMFDGCSKLTSTPILPALTLVSRCYQYMFRNCSLVNYIKALFLTTPGSSYTYNWLQGTANKGTFVKNSSAEWNISGMSGIPNGWTIEMADN